MNELHQRMCKTTDGTASEHQDFTVSSEWSWHFYVTESKNSLFKEKTLSRPTSSRGLYSKVPRIHQRWSIQSWLSLQLRWVGAVLQLLPKKFLAAYFEKSADGCRTQKERVTISVCSNATGKINLPHLLKWKAKNPRCLSMPAELIYPLPICQPSKCMGRCATVHPLVSWPLCSLVSKLREMNLEPKAVLLLHYCSAHPNEEELVSADGLVIAKFFPPNVTFLIQPMDQGVLVSIKRRYWDTGIKFWNSSFFKIAMIRQSLTS